MNEYYLLRRPDQRTVQIAKFTDRNEPDVVYNIRGRSCDCPARGRCKHHELVSRWKLLDEAPVALYANSYEVVVPGILDEYDVVDWLYDHAEKNSGSINRV